MRYEVRAECLKELRAVSPKLADRRLALYVWTGVVPLLAAMCYVGVLYSATLLGFVILSIFVRLNLIAVGLSAMVVACLALGLLAGRRFLAGCVDVDSMVIMLGLVCAVLYVLWKSN